MADKILRIVFSGISTLSPGPPRGGEDPHPHKAFVLMAANRAKRKNQFNDPIEIHTPFIYVPRSILADPIPPPAEVVEDKNLGTCHIYFIDGARVMLDKTPRRWIDYYVDRNPKHKFGEAERPGSNNVACENDIRWLADLRDLLPKRSSALRANANPSDSQVKIGSEVAAIVELRGGTLKANFPCKSVQPKTFTSTKGGAVKGFKRVLATEFFVDMPFFEDTTTVKLLFYPLREGEAPTGIEGNELTLKWGAAMGIEVRMGNDTKDEAKVMTSTKRCDARARTDKGAPLLVPRDNDFDLHYDLLNVPPGAVRPLPTNGPHQTHVDGCSPGTGG